MSKELKEGLHLLINASKILAKYPIFLIPIMCVWLIHSSIIIYLKYFMPWERFSIEAELLIFFLVFFLFAFLLSISTCIMLEFINQIESNKPIDLFEALKKTFFVNFIRIIPISIVWSIIWFFLTILEALFSKRKQSPNNDTFTSENVARTLGGGFEKFSLGTEFFRLLNKGVRMLIFLIIPGIVFENLSTIQAVKKGLTVFKLHIKQFASGFVLTYFAAMTIFLPAAIVFELDDAKIKISDFVWTLTIIYIAIAWSFTIYLEQMYTALLYLWHLKWEKETKIRLERNEPLIQMDELLPPSLLDENFELSPNIKKK